MHRKRRLPSVNRHIRKNHWVLRKENKPGLTTEEKIQKGSPLDNENILGRDSRKYGEKEVMEQADAKQKDKEEIVDGFNKVWFAFTLKISDASSNRRCERG